MRKYLLIGTSVFVVGLFALFSWFNQPNNGSIESSKNDDVLSVSKSTAALQTDLFSTAYDSTLQIKTSNENDNPNFGQYLLASKISDDESQVGITVAPKDGSISDASPAKFRLTSTDYQQVNVPFAPVDSLVFVKNTGSDYEITVVWQGDAYYAAVAGSGTSADKQHINDLVSDVVSNWQWKN